MMPLRVADLSGPPGATALRRYRAMAGMMTSRDWRTVTLQCLRSDLWCADPLGSLPVVAVARALPPAACGRPAVRRGDWPGR